MQEPTVRDIPEAIKYIGHPKLEEILVRYAGAIIKNEPNADNILNEAESIRDELSKTQEGRDTLKRMRHAIKMIIL
jgi:hypothetical protein